MSGKDRRSIRRINTTGYTNPTLAPFPPIPQNQGPWQGHPSGYPIQIQTSGLDIPSPPLYSPVTSNSSATTSGQFSLSGSFFHSPSSPGGSQNWPGLLSQVHGEGQVASHAGSDMFMDYQQYQQQWPIPTSPAQGAFIAAGSPHSTSPTSPFSPTAQAQGFVPVYSVSASGSSAGAMSSAFPVSPTWSQPDFTGVIRNQMELRGAPVPQIPYSTRQDFVPQQPIYFQNDSSYGLFVVDAIDGRFGNLQESTRVVFEGMGQSISIRINWPGYNSWYKQTASKNFARDRKYVTLEKAAMSTSRMVKYFFDQVAAGQVARDPSTDPLGDWVIEPRNIVLEDIVLHSLHNVSKGSWQPVLVVWRS